MDYFLILVVSFLGLPTGWFLNRQADGEREEYGKALFFIREAFVLALFIMVVWPGGRALEGILLFIVYQVLGYLKREDLSYSSLVAPLWLSYPTLYPYAALICFVLGLFSGTFQAKGTGFKDLLSVVINNSGYILIGVLLGLIS